MIYSAYALDYCESDMDIKTISKSTEARGYNQIIDAQIGFERYPGDMMDGQE